MRWIEDPDIATLRVCVDEDVVIPGESGSCSKSPARPSKGSGARDDGVSCSSAP